MLVATFARRSVAVALTIGALGAGLAAVSGNAGAAQHQGTTTSSTWTVPAGVEIVQAHAVGGQGGRAGDNSGGLGCEVYASFDTTGVTSYTLLEGQDGALGQFLDGGLGGGLSYVLETASPGTGVIAGGGGGAGGDTGGDGGDACGGATQTISATVGARDGAAGVSEGSGSGGSGGTVYTAGAGGAGPNPGSNGYSCTVGIFTDEVCGGSGGVQYVSGGQGGYGYRAGGGGGVGMINQFTVAAGGGGAGGTYAGIVQGSYHSLAANDVSPVAEINYIDISTTSLANAVVGTSYSQSLAATFGASTAVTGDQAIWSVTPALPQGLSLDPRTGEISGTPSADSSEQTYTFTAEWYAAADLNEVVAMSSVPLAFAVAPVSYAITIDDNGATTASSGGATDYTSGVQFDLPTPPARSGYTFAGWSVSGSVTPTSIPTTAATATLTGSGAITLTAQWTIDPPTPTTTTQPAPTTTASGDVVPPRFAG